MNSNNDGENDFNNENINMGSQEIGVNCNIVDGNNNLNSNNNENNLNNYNNQNNNEINNIQNQSNNINENFNQNEEEGEEFEEDEEGEDEEESNNYNLVPTENFSQQVDFLFHPENPEWQTNETKKIIKIPKKSKSSSKINIKNNKSKSKIKNKSKNKNKKGNKIIKKKKKIRPEFNLDTKIDLQPKTESIFYGRNMDETRCEKQRKERAQKIAEYEENYSRQKAIYKAKRKKEEDDLKNRYNYLKYKTSNYFYPDSDKQSEKGKIKDDFLKQFKNLSKIDYPQEDIRNYECNPQKYDGIIHALLNEISEIKYQRKKENDEFVNQIKRLQNDLDDNKNKNKKKVDKKRPKSGNKLKIKKNSNKNNVFNIINNYYKPYKSRPKTGNKLKNKNNISYKKKEIENEIPVNNQYNSSKNTTKNNFYQNEKEKIIKNIQDLEIQKNIKINELMNQNNDINNNYINGNNNYNFETYKKSFNENYYSNPNNNISKSASLNQNSNSLNVNNIIYNPVQYNIIENLNPKVLNYQDKMQVLTELNNNIAKFSNGIPKLVNKVNDALNKIYGNTDNPIKKAINNHPFVILASKSAFQMIKSNSDAIIEGIIDDLLLDCVFDLQDIENAQKERLNRDNLRVFLNEAMNNLNIISQNEKEILNNYNIKGKK